MGAKEGDGSTRLRRLRNALGVTQREIAAELGVTHGAVGQWESGRRAIPGPVLKLVTLYEEELGLSEMQPPRAIAATPVARGAEAAQLASTLVAEALAATLDHMVQSDPHGGALTRRTRARIAQRIVRDLSRMRGLPMKLAQTFSYCDFAVPESVRGRLALLPVSPPPIARSEVDEVFIHEHGRIPSRIFALWDEEPFATASLGQVHRARLDSGQWVAVKVQYPNVAEAIANDLRAARVLEQATRLFFRQQRPGAVLAELEERLTEECDYRVEASRQRLFSELFGGESQMHIPRVHDAWSTARILVSDLVEGRDFAAFRASATQDERNRAGETIFSFAFRSIFEHRWFNADPHPGNYLFSDDGVVTFLDFGCVKHFPADVIEGWRAFARALLERRLAEAERLWVGLGMVPQPERFDFAYNRRMFLALYEPWLVDEPFRFSDEYVARIWRLFVLDNPNKFRTNIPKDWVLANRLQWGIYAVLAKLGAEANWRRAILPLFYGEAEEHPPPYDRDELARLMAAPTVH